VNDASNVRKLGRTDAEGFWSAAIIRSFFARSAGSVGPRQRLCHGSPGRKRFGKVDSQFTASACLQALLKLRSIAALQKRFARKAQSVAPGSDAFR
jgi:hypothetical protein